MMMIYFDQNDVYSDLYLVIAWDVLNKCYL